MGVVVVILKLPLNRIVSLRTGVVFALGVLLLLPTAGCYNNNTGEANIGGAIHFKLPAFPETGSHAVEVFTEMHFQPSYRVQEGPRLLPPPESVPVAGVEFRYSSMEEFLKLTVPANVKLAYTPTKGQELYDTNCQVCHGSDLKGDGPIRQFMTKGPFPADLNQEITRNSSDGELFGFIWGGGRQGLPPVLRNKASTSPMPAFRRLLTEDERWDIVLFLRSKIGQ